MAAPTLASINQDTGSSSGDLITKDQSLVLTGTADAYAFVEVFVDGVSLAFGSADSDGDWTIDLGSEFGDLSAGAHAIQILSTFGVNASFSTTYNLTIDLTAPAAPTITSISDDTGASSSDGITTDNTLTFSGTAEANAIIRIFDFGTEIATAQADANGAWTYTSGNLGGDQQYLFSVSQIDVAGNESPRSGDHSIYIDDTVSAPVISTGIADDNGVSGTDGITNDGTIGLTGSGEAGAVVTISDGAGILGTAQVDGSGNWNFTTAALVDGPHSFTATQTDVAGNVSGASTAVAVTIDTVAPSAPTIDATISDDTGSSGTDRLTNDTTVTFTGSAEVDEIVLLYEGATLVGSGQADGTGAWSITTSVLSNGAHTIHAVSRDLAGNESAASGTIDVTIDASAPSAPVIAGLSDDTGRSPSDGVTTDTSVTVTGSAESGSVVTLSDSVLGALGTALADQDGNWSVSYTFAEGGHSLTATAADAAGNTGTASSPFVIAVDTTAPAAPTIDDFSGNTGFVLDNITKNTVITLTGTAEPDGLINIYDDTTLLGTALADGTGNWSFVTPTLSEGTHEFAATATDIAGNEGAESLEFSVEIDTTGPTAAVTSISKPGLGSFDTGASFTDEITRDRTLILSGTTSEPMSSVTIYRDGVSIGTASSDGSGDWSFDYTGTALPDGTYNFTAQATDIAGNTGVVSAALPVTIDNVAPPAALVTAFVGDSGRSDSDHITSDTTVVVSGTAEAGASVEVFIDNVSAGHATADGSGQWSFDHTATTLAEGQHQVLARVTDVAGNSQIGTTPFTFTVDTTGPAAPAIVSIANDTGRSSSDEITNDTTLTLSGTAEADAIVTVIDTSNGDAVVGTVLADGSGDWSVAISALTEGTHNLRATATDAAGNDSAQTADFAVTVDTTAPTAPTITSFQSDTGISNSDGITNDGFGYLVSGTADADSIVRVYLDGGLSGNPAWTALADGNGDWSWFYNGGIGAEGPMVFVATATDVAGNTSGFGPGYTVTFDYTPPAAAVITGISDDRGSSATDGVTSDTTLTINGTSEAFAVITLSEGTLGALGSTQADTSGNWSYVVSTPFAEGDYAFTAAIADRAGNAGSNSAAFAVTVDATAPNTPTITGFSEDTAYIVPSGFPDLGTSFSDGVTHDNTITLNGTGDVGAIITVYDGASALGTALVDGGGNWTYTTDPLPDGEHDFTATASDTAGNESAATPATGVLIDTVSPTRPAVTGVSTDTGSSSTDGVTSDTTITIYGTGEAGTAIWLTSFQVPPGYNVIGGGAGTALVDSNGNWSIDLTGLEVFTSTSPFHAPFTFTDGSYSFFAEALDDAGNGSGFGDSFTVTIDTTAPFAPTIVSFADDTGVADDFLTKDATITLSGTGLANAVLTVLDDGNPIGTALADGAGNWSFTTSALSNATHTFTAFSTDTAGNVGATSDPMAITVDAVAPATPTIDATITLDSGSNATDRVTNDTTVTLTGDAEPNSTVFISAGATLFGSTTADGSGDWSFTVGAGALTDGTYDFVALAQDAAGNFSANSTPLSVTIDATPPAAPAVTGITSDTGSSASDNITQDKTLVISGTAEANSVVTVTEVGVGVLGTAQADGSGNWSFDHTGTALADGPHSFTATATDLAGNTSVDSSALAVTVDNVAPSGPTVAGYADDTGVQGDFITKDNNVTLTGTAEAGSIVTVRDVANGNALIGTTTADGSGNWSLATGVLSEGLHTFEPTATDAAGNVSGATSQLGITVDTTAPATPTIDATPSLTRDDTPTLTGDAEANSTVFITDGATLLGSTLADAAGDWSFTTPPLADGPHAFTATAQDAAGNFSASSLAANIAIDATAPAAPVISSITTDSGPSSTDEITNDTSLTVSGTAEANTLVELQEGGFFVDVAWADSSGNWSIVVPSALAEGTFNFTAVSTDAAGNTSAVSNTLVVVVDTTNPSTPTDSDTGANTVAENAVNGATVGITGSATDAGGVRYSLTNDAGGRFTIDANTGVVTLVDASLIDFETATSHDITIRATDVAGNSSTQIFTVNVTNVAPSTPVDTVGVSGGSIADTVADGTAVGITALSSDIHGGAITYALTDDAGGRFAIDPTTGVVTVADASLLDHGANPSHTITVQASDGNLVSTANFVITVGISGNTITGTALKDTINGTVSAPGQPVATNNDDEISGLAGDDVISGLGGDDVIDGGAGKDRMDGGAGNDTYVVDSTGDKITELAGGGIDLVLSSVAHKLANNVENLTLTGSASVAGTGNSLANVIIGNSGDNTLSGGGGNDRLVGGGGNDTLKDTVGFDTFAFSGNFGNDTIIGFIGNGAGQGDTIEFDASIFADFDAVRAATTDLGNNLLITHANGTILLKGVKDVSLLHESDFTFV